MKWDLVFFFNSVLLGVGLAMDAFSVSLANGLNEPAMNRKKMCGIAGVFAFFQAIMPIIGWICVHTILQCFKAMEKWIPWIALVLLLYIGGRMLIEGIRNRENKTEITKVGVAAILVQGLATSIDALSVGFTIAEYRFMMALVCTFIICIVTFLICLTGLVLGKKFGTRYSRNATILGGAVLIVIGIEIFLTGIFA